MNEPGAYVLTISATNPERTWEGHLVRGFYWSAQRENQRSGINRPALLALAAAGGGRALNGPGDNPFSGAREPRYVDVAPWLLAAALLLFLGELLLPATAGIVRSMKRRTETGLWGDKEAA